MFGYNSCEKARVETLWRALDQALERCFGQFLFWKFWVVFLSSDILFLMKSDKDPWLPVFLPTWMVDIFYSLKIESNQQPTK